MTLGIFGTAMASWLFYILIKRTGSVFSSLVTNTMPIVALILGVLSGEKITYFQIICLFVILFGIYFVNKKQKIN
jgi:drug/metabolite transporter (DMT)-like permease